MRILILGQGGREHALYLKLKESRHADRVFVWPGNGLVPAADRVDLPAIVDAFAPLKQFIEREKIDFTVVGNETPLVHGVRDYLKREISGHYVFGPDMRGAELEGSKAFADAFMVEAKIPHGESFVATSLTEAKAALHSRALPIVLKADGLAAGKGVSIHHDFASAEARLVEIFESRIFGASGNRVLLQNFLEGTEASLFALCNGEEALLLPVARDYKRAMTNDEGENTGGMGAYTPGTNLTPAQKSYVYENIIRPVLKKFRYRGLLYVGLMIASAKADDLAVVEFNCRFGDPETQSILHLIEGDLVEYLLWTDGGKREFLLLEDGGVKLIPYRRGCVVNIVVAADGYPGAFQKDIALQFPKPLDRDLHVVGAGLREEDGKLFSTGGRIANIVAYGVSKDTARNLAYQYLKDFAQQNAAVKEKLYWRTDIASGI